NSSHFTVLPTEERSRVARRPLPRQGSPLSSEIRSARALARGTLSGHPPPPARRAPGAFMNRWTILALGLLCASLAAVFFGALRFIGEERSEMMARFSQERVEQVEQAARIIDEDLVHVGEDLRV